VVLFLVDQVAHHLAEAVVVDVTLVALVLADAAHVADAVLVA
jgi:hypothetical protein